MTGVEARVLAIAILGLVGSGVGCSPHTEDLSSDPQGDWPTLAGEYETRSGGDVAGIGFYGTEYTLRPSSCSDDGTCIVHGTYRVDGVSRTLALHPNGSESETIWPLRIESLAVHSDTTGVRSLHPLLSANASEPAPAPPALIGKPSCLLMGVADSFTATDPKSGATATFSRSSVDTDFENNAIGLPGRPYVAPSTDTNEQMFFAQKLIEAGFACNPRTRNSELRTISWHSVQLVDVQGCSTGSSSASTHYYYTPTGDPVAFYDEAMKDRHDVHYDMTPMTLLMRGLGICH
jgi:hypothetical protein